MTPARRSRGFVLSRLAPLVTAVLVMIGGVLAGFALTRLALRRDLPIGSVVLGAWRLWPNAGNPEIDPYRRAHFATNGQVPLATAEGVMLIAATDEGGRKLQRNCEYRLDGPVPPAHFWSLGAVDTAGFPIGNAADRLAFTSIDILRSAGGGFSVALAPEARPGNWLPVEGSGTFRIVLRLYDTLVSAYSSRDLKSLAVPTVTRLDCR